MQQRVAKESGSEMVELFPEMKNSTITESCTKQKGSHWLYVLIGSGGARGKQRRAL